MTVSHKQQILNDMIEAVRKYVQDNAKDVQCLMLIASLDQRGDFQNHVSYSCGPEMAHIMGHTINSLQHNDMRHLFDDIMSGIACAMITEGGHSLDDLLDKLKTSETMH